MRKTNQDIAQEVIDYAGGVDNICSNLTCMTRLHIRFVDRSKVDLESIRNMKETLGVIDGETLQIVFGPGKVTNVGQAFAEITKIPLGSTDQEFDVKRVVIENKAQRSQRNNKPLQRFFKHFANIFLPILPGIAGAGLINGITKAINVANGNAWVGEWWYALIMTIGWALFTYLPIFVGMNAAKEFKGSPILGGIVGALSISHLSMPLLMGSGAVITLPITHASYNPNAGGILAAVLTGISIAYIERAVRKIVPEVLDMFVTPLLSLLIGGFCALLVLQPMGAFVTTVLYHVADFVFNQLGALGGFILASLQLPLVSIGMHRVFLPIHTLLNDPSGPTQGINYLLPILMVAGGGQVGAAIALYCRTQNRKLKKAILASTPAGILGVGEPLMYAVTLPLWKPFLAACLGSGFGGAVIAFLEVGAISQGVSGILAPLIMNPGSQLSYLIGLFTAYLAGFVLTYCFGYSEQDIQDIFGK